MFLAAEQIDETTPEGKFRIAVAATAIVPAAAIFVAARVWRRSMNLADRKKITGTPPRKWFGFVWFLTVLIWAWITVLSSFYMEWQYLTAFLAMHVVTVVSLVGWLRVYEQKGNGKESVWMLGLAFALILLMLVFFLLAPMDNTPPTPEGDDPIVAAKRNSENARTATALPWTVALSWISYALVTGYLQAQGARG